MKTFLAVYLGAPESFAKWAQLSDAERAEREAAGIKAWHAWVEHHKDSIVDIGGPLGKTLKVSPAGTAPTRNHLTGYTVVRAESHDAAARLFEKHPHFIDFPGDAAEIMQILPIPGR